MNEGHRRSALRDTRFPTRTAFRWRLRKYAGKTAAKIDCTCPGAAGEGAVRDARKRSRAEAENAVRGGAGHIVLTDEAIGPDQAAMPMSLATGAVHSHLVRQGLRTFTRSEGTRLNSSH